MTTIEPSRSAVPLARAARSRGPWHRREHGLHVMKLQGSFYEMGRQHGEMLRSEVREGPLPYYRDYALKLMGSAGLGKLTPLLFGGVSRLVGGQVARQIPPFARDTLRGLSDGAGLPLDHVMDGATLPDTLLWLASRLIQVKDEGPAMHHRLALGIGCTSAIAWGGATRDGKLLHARNFDYHGVDCWPKTAAVVFHEPEEGQRYVSVAAAGVPLGGVTAMNESGLSLTVHQHMFTAEARLGGTPIGLVGDMVMRDARNLDDAESILRRHRPIGCWTYLVTDAKAREVLCWEENPDMQRSRRVGAGDGRETFEYANIYLDPELGATENNLYGSYWRHNLARHRRADALLDEGRGTHDPRSMAGILADTGDSSCRLHESIAMLMTVGSVVFSPEDGKLWVGAGVAPTSHAPFVPFSLDAEGLADGESPFTIEKDPTEARAFEAYRSSYVAYADEGDLEGARRHAEEARRLSPEQPLYHHLVGLLALCADDGRAAAEAFDRALDLGHPDPERVGGFHLWRGRAADLLGRRQEAVGHYRRALGHRADPPVHRAAKRHLSRPYQARSTRRIHIDYSFVDVVTP